MPNETHLNADAPAEMHPTPAELGRGYEVRDTNVWAVLTFAAGLVVVLIATQFGMWGLLKAIAGDRARAAAPLATQESIYDQRQDLRKEEDAVLNGGGPSAHNNPGTSIEDAIERIARKGLPRTPDRPRSEVQVNSHSGTPAPAGGDKKSDKPGPRGGRGGPEKGSDP